MNKTQLKDWILKNYYRSDGTPNSSLSRLSYVSKDPIKLDFHNSMLSETSWLNDHNPSFNDRVKVILTDVTSVQVCKTCGGKVKLCWDRSKSQLFNDFCCIKCARNHDEVKVKTAETNIERYGTANVAKSSHIRKLISSRLRMAFDDAVIRYKEHYGDKFTYKDTQDYEHSGLVEVKCIKHNETFVRNSNSLLNGETNCPVCRKESLRDRYMMTRDEFVERLKEVRGDEFTLIGEYNGMASVATFKCNKGHIVECKADHIVGTNRGNCHYCYNGSSKEEQSFISFIKTLTDDVIANSRKHLGNGKEIDVIVGNLMFEYNGLHYHSSKYLTNDYHLEKTIAANNNGYKLYHVWSHEWMNPQKRCIWESIIKNALGMPDVRLMARKCSVRNIETSEFVKFMNDNHIQGYAHSKIKLGLYFNDELVAAMGFSPTRFSDKYDFELIRFANKKFHSIVGGASKLLNAFMKIHPNKSIISYADRRLSLGNVYQKLGFEFKHFSPPSYFYTRDGYNVYSRYSTQRKNLHKILKNFNPSLSERENMEANGYYKVFDCGTSVWVIENKTLEA